MKLFVAFFFLVAVQSVNASSFGNTQVGSSATFAPCTDDAIVASVEVTVDSSARILYSLGSSAVSLDNSAAYGVGFQAVLKNASNTRIATSQWRNIVVGLYLQSASASELLYATSTNTPVQLAPGAYTLELHLQTSGSCGGAGVYIQSPTLTYVLLSSVLDRIFANGFSMLLSDETDTRVA
jgi:hypothetical protein